MSAAVLGQLASTHQVCNEKTLTMSCFNVMILSCCDINMLISFTDNVYSRTSMFFVSTYLVWFCSYKNGIKFGKNLEGFCKYMRGYLVFVLRIARSKGMEMRPGCSFHCSLSFHLRHCCLYFTVSYLPFMYTLS